MLTLKQYYEVNGLDIHPSFDMVVGEGGGILHHEKQHAGIFRADHKFSYIPFQLPFA